MKHRLAVAHPLENPEVVINLRVYSDEDGTMLRLSGIHRVFKLRIRQEDLW
jgi:hypothetical protein